MGDRYIIPVDCPNCDYHDDGAYYAPTCDFTEWVCPQCGEEVDLGKLTGISYEDASNADEIEGIIKLWCGDSDSDCEFDGLADLIDEEKE